MPLSTPLQKQITKTTKIKPKRNLWKSTRHPSMKIVDAFALIVFTVKYRKLRLQQRGKRWKPLSDGGFEPPSPHRKLMSRHHNHECIHDLV